ncbi:MAG TPA: condensation domain-containing protein, partial [Candidatus Acidoferrales bacterium]|nr:condensation domain-containing protein [Candidatus Acidoferrales bacterium]
RGIRPGSREKIILPEKLANRLTYWTREQRSSIFMTLLAGFQYLLHHYSHDEDIAVGTCVANRPQMQLEDLIGRFGNHVVIRTSMAGNPSFQEVQQRVRESSLTAYGYQEMPFGEVLRAVRPRGDVRCDGVVQAMFVFQNAPKSAWQIPGLDIRWLPVKRASTRYDLTMWLRETQGIEVALEYNTDLFRAATIQNVLNDYRAILEHVAAHPSTPFADHPWQLTTTEMPQFPAAAPRLSLRDCSNPTRAGAAAHASTWRHRPFALPRRLTASHTRAASLSRLLHSHPRAK